MNELKNQIIGSWKSIRSYKTRTLGILAILFCLVGILGWLCICANDYLAQEVAD